MSSLISNEVEQKLSCVAKFNWQDGQNKEARNYIVFPYLVRRAVLSSPRGSPPVI